MKTYILKVRPESFDRNNQMFNKVGNPQVFDNIVIVETDATLDEIQRVKGVISVHEDEQLSIDGATDINNVNNSWGMKYIKAPGTGDNVDVFLLDSGVRSSHEFFKNKKIVHYWSADDKEFDTTGVAPDHGTMCCAMILATAPKTTVYSVRTNFLLSNTIKALDMCAAHHQTSKRNTIVSMSFSMESTIDYYSNITKKLYDMGVVLVGSAGNRGSDKPGMPASSNGVYAVGAIENNGEPAYFSSGKKSGNSFWAPGTNLGAPLATSDASYGTFSGTSAATPIIAGVIASCLTGSDKITSNAGVKWVKEQLKKNKINKKYPGGGVLPLASGYSEKWVEEQPKPEPIPEPVPEPIVEPIPEPAPAPIVEPIPEPEPMPPQKEKKKDKTQFIVGAIAIVVIVGVILFNIFKA